MFKNNKGISLVVLVIMIMVMAIIFGITMSSADDLLRNSQKNRLKVSMNIVQSRGEVLLEDYLFDGTDKLGEEATLAQINKVGWAEDSKYIYRSWDMEMIKAQGIEAKDFTADDSFIIQYNIEDNEVDVASYRGFVDSDGTLIYTLTALKNK